MREYRTTLLLCAFVLLGWAWDFSLGGGVQHGLGWLAALVLVGGISALSTYSKRFKAAATEPETSIRQGQTATAGSAPGVVVRPARPDELPELIEVEIAADRLFPLAGYGETPGPATVEDLQQAACVLVSGDPAVGYARVEVLDGHAHLESLSVRPKYMRQGRGSALVTAAIVWAAEQGYDRMTLTTFADVPWNGPFYAQLGFVELAELSPGLAETRAAERDLGLDAMGRRIVMVRSLERLEP